MRRRQGSGGQTRTSPIQIHQRGRGGGVDRFGAVVLEVQAAERHAARLAVEGHNQADGQQRKGTEGTARRCMKVAT